MNKRIVLLIFCTTLFTGIIYSQKRLEIDVSVGYSNPTLEARGENVVLSPQQDYLLIAGERWLTSDNLGTDVGYGVQAYLKYSLLKSGYVKGVFNLGYNRLFSHFDGPNNTTFGCKVQSFSIGLGTEILALPNKKFTPSIYGLLRINFMGGETFHLAGLDFFKVVPRFGYSAGINLNYKVSKRIGIFAGGSYSYDNLWGKDTDETITGDVHTIVFRDKANATNGLKHDRRVAYPSFYGGMSFGL